MNGLAVLSADNTSEMARGVLRVHRDDELWRHYPQPAGDFIAGTCSAEVVPGGAQPGVWLRRVRRSPNETV
jgi:hypothetical protein